MSMVILSVEGEKKNMVNYGKLVYCLLQSGSNPSNVAIKAYMSLFPRYPCQKIGYPTVRHELCLQGLQFPAFLQRNVSAPMEVCFLCSGEDVAVLDAADIEGKTAKDVKRSLVKQLGVTRFRQRFFLEAGLIIAIPVLHLLDFFF